MGNRSFKRYIKHRDDPNLTCKRIQKRGKHRSFVQCSFENWVAKAAKEEGFADTADFETIREDFRSKGLLMKPDTTDGRCIHVRSESKEQLTLEEPRQEKTINITIPPYHTSGKLPPILDSRFQRGIPMQTIDDGMSVIGCHKHLCVVQILQQKLFWPEFYIIDMEKEVCIGKYQTKDCSLVWHECYISPDLSRIVIRPDTCTYMYAWSPLTDIRTQQYEDAFVMYIKQFPEFAGQAITFDRRHGNRYMFHAKDKDIQRYDLLKMAVIQSIKHTDIVFSIRQLFSSQSGDYLAARCTPPVLSHAIRIKIVIFSAETLHVLQQIEPVAGYWMISVISLQVFPRFSATDSTVAVMRHGPTKPRVHLFELPTVMTTLQHSCRKIVRTYVSFNEIHLLPIPTRLVKYLRYEL